MSRVAAPGDAVRFVVLAVACMMVVSIGGAGGYVFLPDGSGQVFRVAAPFMGAHPEEAGEDGTDAQEGGFPSFGMEALGETFAPEFLPLSDGGRISPLSMTIHSSAHLPRIYRPPIL
jgi:hypothetical protein